MLQVGGGAYYNRCPGMLWAGNLFENNTAQSGSAGLELNQCAGDVERSTFFNNKVQAAPFCVVHLCNPGALEGRTLNLTACLYTANGFHMPRSPMGMAMCDHKALYLIKSALQLASSGTCIHTGHMGLSTLHACRARRGVVSSWTSALPAS